MKYSYSRLLILDIDGTLMHTGGAGLRAFREAANQVLQKEVVFKREDFAGKLDLLVFKKLYISHYDKETGFEGAWRSFQELYLDALEKESRQCGTWHVYPGVRTFLSRESRRSALSLLTGNMRRGAEIKLGAVDLLHYFPCGAFGEAAGDRNALAAIALAVSQSHFNRTFNEVWVIGDTISDIECGRSIGAKTLGVRTGFSKEGELEAAGATRVIRTFEELDESF